MKQALLILAMASLSFSQESNNRIDRLIQESNNRIDRLIQELSSTDGTSREKASKELVSIGKDALPALIKLSKEGDLDAQMQAKVTLDKIEWEPALEAAKKYAFEFYSGEEVTVDFMSMRALLRYFPDKRIIEVRTASAPKTTLDPRSTPARGVFIASKYESDITPVISNGIYMMSNIVAMAQNHKITMKNGQEAINFAQVFCEIHRGCSGRRYFASRMERTDEGWMIFQDVGTTNQPCIFKLDKDGYLIDIVLSHNYSPFQKSTEEKDKLELEKLKLEIEFEKRQLSEPSYRGSQKP